MTNLASRTITCVVGVPALAVIIFLLPQYNFLALSIFCIVMVFLGSREMSKILFGKVVFIANLTWLLPLISYLFGNYTEITLAVFAVMIFSKHIFTDADNDFKDSSVLVSKEALLLLYPAYLFTFVIRMLALKTVNAYSILLFLLLVFSNDIFAYVFGRLFGKGNQGIVKASPKKSLAGFIGGYICCIALCVAYFSIFKENLPSLSIIGQILFGTGMSILANLGDLLESVFKRSAGEKDSGSIVPGRGGILDSTDSIMSTAPLFYFVFSIL